MARPCKKGAGPDNWGKLSTLRSQDSTLSLGQEGISCPHVTSLYYSPMTKLQLMDPKGTCWLNCDPVADIQSHLWRGISFTMEQCYSAFFSLFHVQIQVTQQC